ncbi:response regulator [Paenibacillus sp. P96]|uniref:Response regulator n=1 Tax=Paenibacillus zeirhizosphaerae TaxID=2987519 RepID=A0ABT9FRH8_9BACL|nr:response regulator [Paenibacillus sp. P96]MDP4097339.1 response regulator [Paenibacillus sp. P96]
MKRVLIADDEKNIRLGLKAMVEREFPGDFECYTAQDGRQAWNQANETPMDIVITDIRMPRMDGIQLMRQLRHLQPRPLVAVLSGYGEFQYAKEAIRCGAQEYLLKPVIRDDLFSMLKDMEETLNAREQMNKERELLQRRKEDFRAAQLNYILMSAQHDAAEVMERLKRVEMDWAASDCRVAVLDTGLGTISGVLTTALTELESGGHAVAFNDMEGRAVLVTDNGEWLQSWPDRLRAAGLERFHMGTSADIGKPGHFKESYVQAKQALQSAGRPGTAGNGGKLCELDRAVDYIHKHYREDLNMAVVSNLVSLNYTYFSQAFKSYTGVSFVQYLKNVRIYKSKELLEGTGLKIYEVAAAVGFENAKHFNKVFREKEGITPQEYRARYHALHRGGKVFGGMPEV